MCETNLMFPREDLEKCIQSIEDWLADRIGHTIIPRRVVGVCNEIFCLVDTTVDAIYVIQEIS